MTRVESNPRGKVRNGRTATIRLDAEFQELVAPLSAGEGEQKLAEFRLHGCQERLVVWPFEKKQVLLVGYEVFPILKEHRIPFRVVFKRLTNREEARMYFVKEMLGRLGPTSLHASYLRGVWYEEEKEQHGGDRSGATPRLGALRSGAALAERYAVSLATIRRDGELRRAVDELAAEVGAEAKAMILGRGSKLKRAGVLALAKMPAERQKEVIDTWRFQGQLPRGWRYGGPPPTMTVPREPSALVAKLAVRLTPGELATVADLLAKVIAAGELAGKQQALAEVQSWEA